MNWRRIFGQHLRHMTPEQAAASLRRIQLRVGLAEQPEVRRLTGLRSVSPAVVQQVCEKLGEHSRVRVAVRAFDSTEQAD